MPTRTGKCLCGGVQYTITGEIRDVVYCHCEQCRRSSGHFFAATNCTKDQIELTRQDTLKWYRASASASASASAQRGFCGTCGASLFWESDAGDCISILAGSLDQPTGLKGSKHIFADHAGDYYRIDDGLSVFAKSD